MKQLKHTEPPVYIVKVMGPQALKDELEAEAHERRISLNALAIEKLTR